MKQIRDTAIALFCATMVASCGLWGKKAETVENKQDRNNITSSVAAETANRLKSQNPGLEPKRIERGVEKVARLWRESDGNDSLFTEFCLTRFEANDRNREILFNKLSRNYEVLFGHFSLMQMRLQEPLELTGDEITAVDELFGGYDASAHLFSDLYGNKIAFITLLNFPAYTLDEKNNLGMKWSRKEWAYARMGELFEARVPASLNMAYAALSSQVDSYIAGYNIKMGTLINHDQTTLFPPDMSLLSHWNLRDEIKSNYADKVNGLSKQKMIQQVMTRIVDQTIPREVINNSTYQWNPFTNEILKDGASAPKTEEGTVRYQYVIDLFNQLKAQDPYYAKNLDTYIKRKFDGEMEISQSNVEKLFIEFLSSPLKEKVGALISQRLGRPLEPFDIWYDGFKTRSTLSQELLDQTAKGKYPNAAAFKEKLPYLLMNIGFNFDRANFLAQRIEIDAARGSGHARGAQMKSDNAHLRTRIGESGMDYKGFNIAIHELGHNVEQTLSLQNVDYYLLNGVPNTSFTEALAFMFQARDLPLLGYNYYNAEADRMSTLDTFWSLYEIMGVSLIDMRMWKWLYDHPEASADELKHAVLQIAKEVWNSYYASVLGQKESPILAIYSHLVAYPLYLSAYSFGHIIHFQLENAIKGKNFATEVERIYTLGRLTPDLWMEKAVGQKISIQPILKATEEAMKGPALRESRPVRSNNESTGTEPNTVGNATTPAGNNTENQSE